MINRTTATTTGAARQRRKDHRSYREEGADVRQDIRDAREHRKRQRVRHAARHQEDERKDRNEQARDHLPADVRADDRLQVHHDAGEADVVRAGDDGEKPAAKPVAVDHDVEREKDGACAVRNDLEQAHREGKGLGAEGTRERVVLHVPQPDRERRRQVGAVEMIRKACAKCGLLLDQRRGLLHERWYRQRRDKRRSDEEEREDDADRKAAPDTPRLHPADGRTHRPYDEKSDDKDQEDRPKPDQQPHAGHNENELDHRRGRYFEAHHARFLVIGVPALGERRGVNRAGRGLFFHDFSLRVTVQSVVTVLVY